MEGSQKSVAHLSVFQPLPVQGPSKGQHTFDVIANATGCDDAVNKIACLRLVPFGQLVAATSLLPGVRCLLTALTLTEPER